MLEFTSRSVLQHPLKLKQVAERYISSASNLIHIKGILPQLSGNWLLLKAVNHWGKMNCALAAPKKVVIYNPGGFKSRFFQFHSKQYEITTQYLCILIMFSNEAL